MANYYLDRIRIAGTTVGGLVNARFSRGLQTSIEAGGSTLYPERRVAMRSDADLTFETVDIGTILGVLTTGAPAIPHRALATATPVILYLASTPDGGTRGGAGTNIVVTGYKGIVYPVSLNMRGGIVSLTCAVAIDYDGTNPLLNIQTGQNLLSGSAAAVTLWRAAVVENGTSIVKSIADMTVTFGIGIQRENSANFQSLTTVIDRFAPSMTFASADLGAALNASGLAAFAPSAGLSLYLAELSAAGIGYLTTGAYKLTFRQGSCWYPVRLSLTREATGRAEYAVIGRGGSAATEPPLAISSGATVPALTAGILYRLGPVKDNTTELIVTGADVNFNVSPEVEPLTARAWPTHVSIRQFAPTMTIAMRDADYFAAVGARVAVTTAFTIWARAMADNGLDRPDADVVHLRLRITSGSIEPADVNSISLALTGGGIVVSGHDATGAATLTIGFPLAIT